MLFSFKSWLWRHPIDVLWSFRVLFPTKNPMLSLGHVSKSFINGWQINTRGISVNHNSGNAIYYTKNSWVLMSHTHILKHKALAICKAFVELFKVSVFVGIVLTGNSKRYPNNRFVFLSNTHSLFSLGNTLKRMLAVKHISSTNASYVVISSHALIDLIYFCINTSKKRIFDWFNLS